MTSLTSGSRIMSRPLLRLLSSARYMNVGWGNRGVTTVPPPHSHHPNPGNFANRSHDELSIIGRKGGKKGGKARGVGGFHGTNTEKQHVAKGDRARRKAAEHEEAELEAVQRDRSNKPSIVPPGFEEWKTCA